MNIFSKFWLQVNIFGQCNKLGLPLRQCPSFLFLVMGVVVIMAILASYFIAARYGFEPELQALLALFVAVVTFTVGHFVIESFAKVAEVSMLKSQFLNTVSHQLLTPLSSLKWSLNVLYSERIKLSDKEREDIIDIINQSSENMIGIVNSLLDVSRIAVGKIKLEPEEVHLEDLVLEVLKEKKKDIDLKSIVIDLEVEEGMPQVEADRKRIKMSIANLVDNAIKFSKEDNKVFIKLFKSKKEIIFFIEDFGIGISKAESKNIYSKFYKTKSSFETQTNGFGLGLFAAKFIVDASGGKMKFESQKGVGSRFWFSLPVHHKI